MPKPKTPEQIARSRREASFPRCAAPHCGNVAGLNQTHCSAHREEPVTFRYETDAMHSMRQRLLASGYTDDQIDNFKDCLTTLERQGLHLVGELKC